MEGLNEKHRERVLQNTKGQGLLAVRLEEFRVAPPILAEKGLTWSVGQHTYQLALGSPQEPVTKWMWRCPSCPLQAPGVACTSEPLRPAKPARAGNETGSE